MLPHQRSPCRLAMDCPETGPFGVSHLLWQIDYQSGTPVQAGPILVVGIEPTASGLKSQRLSPTETPPACTPSTKSHTPSERYHCLGAGMGLSGVEPESRPSQGRVVSIGPQALSYLPAGCLRHPPVQRIGRSTTDHRFSLSCDRRGETRTLNLLVRSQMP